MSDLDDAVRAEIDAFAPSSVPPFAALAGRRRARDRRRLAAAGAALSAVVLSVAVLVPSLRGGPDRLPALDAPAPTTAPGTGDEPVSRAAVRPAPADGGYQEALATGVLRADPATGCLWLEQPAGGTRTQLLLQGEQYSVDFGASPTAVLDDDTVVARVGNEVKAGGGLSDDEAGVDGCPVPLPVFVGYFERPSAQQQATGGEALPVPADPSSATICADAVRDGGCRVVDRQKARDLAGAFGTARRAQDGEVRCTAMPVPYVVTFADGGAPAGGTYTVPSACAPLRLDGASYELDQETRDLVARLHESAPVPPVDSIWSGTAPQTVTLTQYACGLLPLELQGKEWVRPPFSPADPPDGFSGEGTATRKNDIPPTPTGSAQSSFSSPANPPSRCRTAPDEVRSQDPTGKSQAGSGGLGVTFVRSGRGSSLRVKRQHTALPSQAPARGGP